MMMIQEVVLLTHIVLLLHTIAEVLLVIAAAVVTAINKYYNNLNNIQNTNINGGNTMLSNFGLGSNMKAARTGDQIDAQVTAARGLLTQATMAANNFDAIEMQMQQVGQMLGQTQDPAMQMLAMQFQMLQQNIDSTQKQIQGSLNQLAPVLQEIDNLTNKIQN